MNRLYTRLAVALVVILAVVGSGFYVIERWSSQRYYEELTQRLNSSIAMYVTGATTLLDKGEVNSDELATLAERAMIINPTVEVYLLDTEGRILGHALPPETVQTDRVDLGPIKELIAGDAQMPIQGTDPRSDRNKVFSAAEVRNGDQLEGYLYVVLGGQKYDELASSLRGSYVQTTSVGSLVALSVAALLAGLLTFGLLTRPLTRLTREVQDFTDSGFDAQARAQWPSGEGAEDGDEIDRLSAAFTSMADKIQEQFEGLKETDRLRRELVSNVSHDLRTPLASLHGYVDTLLLKNDELSAEEREHYLLITRKHTRRLGQLIGDLFELSKLESASVHPQLEPFSLAELLSDVAQEFELEAEKRGIALSIERGEAAPSTTDTVVADIGLMQRVLENLLKNALAYTPESGSVTLRLDPRPDRVAVSVSDTGCGIPEEEIEHIFDRFYRARPTEKSSPGADAQSCGLGLAIVKRILDLHGSRITVTSQVDEGTRFEFDLPVAA